MVQFKFTIPINGKRKTWREKIKNKKIIDGSEAEDIPM